MDARRRFLVPMFLVFLAAAALLLAPVGCQQSGLPGSPQGAAVFESFDYFPPEVLVAGGHRLGDLVGTWDRLTGFVRGLQDEGDREEFDEGLRKMEEELGFGVREDLLPLFGGEATFAMFLDSLDAVAALGINPSPAGTERALGGMLFTVGCTDFQNLDRLVDTVLAKMGAARSRHAELEGNPVWRVPVGKGKEQAALYYVRHRERLLVAFSPDTLAAAVGRFASGPSLPESGDFQRVRNHLPAQVTSLGYINLPGLAARVRTTGLVQLAASANPDMQRLLNLFTAAEMVPFGMGWATSLQDGGVMRTSYGPNTILGQLPIGGAGIGLPALAAIAIPNFLAAQDRGQQKRTMADIRSVATAVESFAVDENRYPAQRQLGLIGEIAGRLEPTYIRTLPRVDAWGGRLLYWSDGEDYLIVSGGQDLMPETDLRGLRALEAGPSQGGDEDIVYSGGRFVRWPEGARD